MKTVLLTLARDNYLLAMIVWFEAINPVLLDAFLLLHMGLRQCLRLW